MIKNEITYFIILKVSHRDMVSDAISGHQLDVASPIRSFHNIELTSHLLLLLIKRERVSSFYLPHGQATSQKPYIFVMSHKRAKENYFSQKHNETYDPK